MPERAASDSNRADTGSAHLLMNFGEASNGQIEEPIRGNLGDPIGRRQLVRDLFSEPTLLTATAIEQQGPNAGRSDVESDDEGVAGRGLGLRQVSL